MKHLDYDTITRVGTATNGQKAFVKVMVPKKRDGGDIPSSIVIGEAPGIHYENDMKPNNEFKGDLGNDDDSIESSVDDSCCSYNLDYHNDSVFRRGFEDIEEEQENGQAPALFIQRQEAFSYSRSMESIEDFDIVIGDEKQRPPVESSKASRPRFMRGIRKFLKPKKKEGGSK